MMVSKVYYFLRARAQQEVSFSENKKKEMALKTGKEEFCFLSPKEIQNLK